MRLHRFYIEEKLGGRNEIRIADEALLHQLKDVFRLTKGDSVIFFDGGGMDITFKIEMISKKEAVFVKESEELSLGQRDVRRPSVALLMALIKKDNFELVLQKCTELGVSRFVPIAAERSEKKNIDMDRARRIIKEAAEQCGRGNLPTVGEITNLELAITNCGKEIIAFDTTGESIRNLKLPIDNCSILIGPEGGWSDKELEIFKNKNIPIFNLGELTLRAETAAIVASTLAII